MFCAFCHRLLREAEIHCPACGHPVMWPARSAQSQVVEGTLERGAISEATQPDDATDPRLASSLPLLDPRTPLVHPVLGTVGRLPALAWRRPEVRAAVRTGATAVLLSMTMRMVGRWLARRSAPPVPTSDLTRAMTDLLGGEQPLPPAETRRRRRDVSETFIFIRRATHR